MGQPTSTPPTRATHTIGARRFGDYGFEITADDPRVADYFDALYHEFEPADPAGLEIHPVAVLTEEPFAGHLVIDGQMAATDTVPGGIVSTVVPALTRRMIDACDLLGLHAGGVTLGETALALPAPMESGKSTLTAGLVRAGFAYLTDEAVLLDWETTAVVPFPKPISLDAGSWALFPELEPRADLPNGAHSTQWHVPPAAIRSGAMGSPGRVGHFVFPRYVEGSATRLTPLPRGEAVIELAYNTFRFNERPRRSLDTLAAAVRAADCHRLEVGELGAAVDLLGTLADGAR